MTEAERIRLAHHFDPYLAIHTSLIDPLPHQISAVYEEMLPRQPLRFLLADDPGAGKTIMAGLLVKELIARSDLERCLVVAPGNLVEQWQDELGDKFGLEFDILTRDMVETSRSGNPFEDCDLLVARLDMLARDAELQERLAAAREWDFIVCDEAHRMSASWSGGEISYTKRYQLGQKLGGLCRHLLLMSATPHNGREEDFQLFMALLDGDRFEGRFRDGVHYADAGDMMRRLTKEQLLRFDGRPLFPERRAYTVRYALSDEEMQLYAAVTEYVREEMNRVQRFAEEDGRKRVNVGFALQILQRRLASSPAAIYWSLKRRRERLEAERHAAGSPPPPAGPSSLFEMEEYAQDEIEELEERISAGATAAETVEQLDLEIGALGRLEAMALGVLQSGRDTKWMQLDRILDEDLMMDSVGNRRKLIVFSEARDTLHYLANRVRGRLGNPNAVDVIHGGIRREDRRRVIERFMQDRDLLVLIANDAAGEGVNLQRGHLMVNYDLPWNPNRIEQRFGRIHRIGQTEVCHLWNLVAADTREGAVYARLLEKLETARQALGGRVYDVLGELFEGADLRDLLFEAVRYGERDEVRDRLFRRVDGAADQDHLLELLRRRALTDDAMPGARVRELRLEMEQADAQRLQPHHIQSFFIETFQHLGGRLRRREEDRWEVTHVPLRVRERSGRIRRRYERICFEKQLISRQPVAAFVCPGHPLLEAVIDLMRERYGHLMKQGAVLVDEADEGRELSAIFLLEHVVRDGRATASGNPHVVSRKLQFAVVNSRGEFANAGLAPHLDLRPATAEEREAMQFDWLKDNPESAVLRFATVELAQRHLNEVKARRLPEIDRVEREVQARLKKEINYWDSRAAELREQERAGKKTRLSWRNAERRAEELAERRERRMERLREERFISSQPPRLLSGMIVVPRGVFGTLSGDAAARREIELAAMEAVMETERKLGNHPEDVSADRVGYDIASYDPKADRMRFIEVKGRVDGAETVMVTRQEVITSLHEPGKYILAIVWIENGMAAAPRYVRGALANSEPSFEQTAIQFSLDRLLKRAEAPS